MDLRLSTAAMAVILSAGCAATTPPPRFSPVSPAEVDAPEAAMPPAAASLTGAAANTPADSPPAKPAAGHQGHSMPAETHAAHEHEGQAPAASVAPAAAETYSCPHHPEVRQSSPGSCPRCGATLERRPASKEQP